MVLVRGAEMSPIAAVSSCLRNYAKFSGRAARAEFWWFILFCILASFLASLLDSLIFAHTGISVFNPLSIEVYNEGTSNQQTWISYGEGLLCQIATFGLLLPQLAVGARRLHDSDHSAWWLLLILIPALGWLVLLVWYVFPSTPFDNRFGPNPHRRTTTPPKASADFKAPPSFLHP